MDIQTIELINFKGIKKGMGLDRFFLDMSEMMGMITLAGKTGSGKTTILENLHPYTVMPSRANPALINQVYGRDAMKVLTFIHEGDHFKCQVKLDAEARRLEGKVFVNRSTKSENDGKISTYKKFIQDLLGSQNLFFQSVFCAQNSPKMSDMQPGDLKALIAEFLGKRLAKLVEQSDIAKECSKRFLNEIEMTDRTISSSQKAIDDLTGVPEKINGAKAELESTIKEIDKTEKSKIALKEQLESLKEKQLLEKDIQREIESSMEKISIINDEINARKESDTKAQGEIKSKGEKLRSREEELNKTLELKDRIKGAGEEIKKLKAENRRLLDLDSELRKIEAEWRGHYEVKTEDRKRSETARIQNKQAFITKREKIKDEIREIGSRIADLERAIQDAENNNAIREAKSNINLAEAMAKDLERRGNVYFDGAVHEIEREIQVKFPCNSTDCSFIQRALEAAEKLPEARKNLGDLQAAVEESLANIKNGLKKEIEARQKQEDALNNLERVEDDEVHAYDMSRIEVDAEIQRISFILGLIMKERNSIEEMGITKSHSIDMLEDLYAKLPEIKIAESELENVCRQIKELAEQYKQIDMDRVRDLKEKNDAKAAETKKIEGLREKLDPDIVEAIESISATIIIKTNRNGQLLKEKSELERGLAKLEQQQESIDKASNEILLLRAKRDRLVTEQTNWRYLQEKCGKNGIQALEINSIAPSIVHDGNRLLETAFGPGEMVDIETLDEDGNEVLRLKAIDQDGESVLIGDRSGGQQRWGMKAMRLAMIGVSRKKSGINLLTTFSDEEDDGLDPESAIRFTKLYRVFLNEHGFNKAIYISHKRECTELADHIIRLGWGGAVDENGVVDPAWLKMQ